MASTRSLISAFCIFLDFRGKATFSSTVMWGQIAYDWKTIPSSRLSGGNLNP